MQTETRLDKQRFRKVAIRMVSVCQDFRDDPTVKLADVDLASSCDLGREGRSTACKQLLFVGRASVAEAMYPRDMLHFALGVCVLAGCHAAPVAQRERTGDGVSREVFQPAPRVAHGWVLPSLPALQPQTSDDDLADDEPDALPTSDPPTLTDEELAKLAEQETQMEVLDNSCCPYIPRQDLGSALAE